MITVGQNRPKNIQVVTTPKNVIEVKGSGGGSGGVSKLSLLSDVDATNVNDQETLVFDAATGKYVVKELPRIDGGEF